MGVLLVILKIIGILLLVLIGIILLIIASVLFVPVRYGAQGQKYDEAEARAYVKWFFGILKADIAYENNEVYYRFSIFGRKITDTFPKEENVHVSNEYKKQDIKEEADEKTEQPKAKEVTFDSVQSAETHKAPVFIRENISSEEKTKAKFEKINSKIEERKKNTTSAVVRRVKVREEDTGAKSAETKENAQEEKINKDYFLKMPFSEKKQLAAEGLGYIKKILKGVKPNDLNVDIKVGTDDPALTGYILAAGSFIRGTVFTGLNICADFDKKVFEGKGSLRGRIIIGYLLLETVKFALKKPIWKIIKIYLKGRGVKK